MARLATAGSFSKVNPKPGPGRPRREFVLCELAKAERQRVIDVHKEIMNDEEAPPVARLNAAQQLGDWAEGKTCARPWMLEEPIVADFSTEAGCVAAIREVVVRVYAGQLPPEHAHLMIRMAAGLILAERGQMEERIRAMLAELQQAVDTTRTQKAQIEARRPLRSGDGGCGPSRVSDPARAGVSVTSP